MAGTGAFGSAAVVSATVASAAGPSAAGPSASGPPSRVSELEELQRRGVYLAPPLRRELSAAGAGSGRSESPSAFSKQESSWVALRKGIHGLVNRVSVDNIKEVLPSLFELNLVRGRGLLARALMKAQVASPGYTHVYASVAAVVNTKLPELGELLLTRVVVRFRQAFASRNKAEATALVRFVAHLVNQLVAHEVLALQDMISWT